MSRRVVARSTRNGGPGGLLLVEGHLKESGGLRVTHALARLLPRREVSTTLFVVQRTDDGATRLVPDPTVHVVYGSDAPQRARVLLPSALRRLVRAARGADVVMAGSEIGWGLLLGWAAARIARRPFAVLVQGSLPRAVAEWLPPWQRALTCWVHRHVDLAVCVSAGLVPDIVANGLPVSKTVVVPVGVDVDALAVQATGVVAPATAPPYFVAAGRLSPIKGFDVLIRAVGAARDRLGDHRLVILGEGSEREHLQQLVDELDLHDRVSLAGFVSEPQPLLAGASAFVLSSRSEGMGGLVLLEAMVHGTPIIATDCVSGPRELLRDGEVGQLVEVDDVDGLAEALAAHVADPEPLRARAALGPARVQDFGADGFLSALIAVLTPLGLRVPVDPAAAEHVPSAAQAPVEGAAVIPAPADAVEAGR